MKEVKETNIKLRLTVEEKEKLKQYAKEHNTTMSELIRELCYKIFNKE